MKHIFSIQFFILIAIISLAFIPIPIKIEAKLMSTKPYWWVRFNIGLLKFEFDQLADNKMNTKVQATYGKGKNKELKISNKALNYLFKHVYIKKIMIKISYAAFNCAQTALLYGILEYLSNFIKAWLLLHTFCPKDKLVSIVSPYWYSTAGFATEVNCIFKVSFGYIVICAMLALYLYIKGGKICLNTP